MPYPFDEQYISDMVTPYNAMPEIIQVISKYNLSVKQTQEVFSNIMDRLVCEPLAIHECLLQTEDSDSTENFHPQE